MRCRLIRTWVPVLSVIAVAGSLMAAIPSVALGAKASASISLTNTPGTCDLSWTFTWSGMSTSTGGTFYIEEAPSTIVNGPVSLPAGPSGMSTLTFTGQPGQEYGAFADLFVTKKPQAKFFPGGLLGNVFVLPLNCVG